MKGKTGRQLKLLEAAQKKIRKQKKKKCGKAKTECFHAMYFHIFISHLCGMWRDILG
jgi:hypothetical protein